MSAKLVQQMLQKDPLLTPFAGILQRRLNRRQRLATRLTGGRISLADFASGHEYFGLKRTDDQWVLREWAPNATDIYLIGELNEWREQPMHRLERISGDGVWEIKLPDKALWHGALYRLRLHWPGGAGERIPAWTRRVVQDPHTLIFNAQVWQPPQPYVWHHTAYRPPAGAPLIYEAHVGMAQEDEKIGTYREFSANVLPRIVEAGYNTLQLMAIQEHPYYGSFGYHVSSFFAASSRFGPPEDLKALVDAAHGAGLRVIMDLVHSHAVSNEVEGLSRFDGTLYQFFHDGPRGRHEAWDSRCFDYGKLPVLHFLLSNCRFWLDEYHVDGFRFDGITSMLYLHHGLGKAFTGYEDYFDHSVDEDALAYLALANQVIHEVRPDAVTIAEDISGMPGLALPYEHGGSGFDYRFAMGVPDHWIRLTKDTPDEHWPMGHLWYELNNRRQQEGSISYAESHDQALVGDQTLIFRLIGADMYTAMHQEYPSLSVDRGLALHKLIRLITLATAGSGYLNFMGNEFGHPEWIDFPRPGNNWSYRYARRQWSLVDAPHLRYHFLGRFDRDMIHLAQRYRLLEHAGAQLLHLHEEDKIVAFQRAGLLFVFNFHPQRSLQHYRFTAAPGVYHLVLSSDHPRYGGHARLKEDQTHWTLPASDGLAQWHLISLYLPSRTAQVLELRNVP